MNNMNKNDQRKIIKNLVALRKAIQGDVLVIAEMLHRKNVFSNEEISEIKTVKPCLPQLQSGMLINKLLRSGQDAYGKFKHVLLDTGHTEIVRFLEETTQTVSNHEVVGWPVDREKTFVVMKHKVQTQQNLKVTNMEEESEEEDVELISNLSEEVAIHLVDESDHQNGTSASPTSRLPEDRWAYSRLEGVQGVHQLERVMTFVIDRLGDRETTLNNIHPGALNKVIREKVKKDSRQSKGRNGGFNSMVYNNFSLTPQSVSN